MQVVEKIMSSQGSTPSTLRYAAGQIVIGTLIFTSANISIASAVIQNPLPGTARYLIEATFRSSEKRSAPRFEVDEGESIVVRLDHADELLVGILQVHKTSSAKNVQIKATINNGGLTVAQATLISTLEQSVGILVDTEQGPVELDLLVTEIR